MKNKPVFGVLVFSVAIICLAGCNDKEDKTGYHLELSENACEVTQLRTTSVPLVAHENTTLEIASPDLLEAVFKWNGHEGFNASIEITGKRKGETDITVRDNTTGEHATLRVKITDYPMPRLAVKQAKANIFDVMEFYLVNGSDAPLQYELSLVCDSMVWTVKGLGGSYRIFEHAPNQSHLVLKWGQCFMFPGGYETYLTAWKDNKAIFHDTLDINVTNDKDFLTYNWKDITKTSQAWSGGYADVIGSNPDLMTTYDLNGSIPSVDVVVSKAGFAQSEEILYSYFRKLYSEPTYEDKNEKQKMFQLYDELFSKQKKYPNAYPCAIWVTEHANVVLLMDESSETSRFVVYAEPGK